MDQQREQASQIAHEFIVYQESEQADIDAKDHQFDALWPVSYTHLNRHLFFLCQLCIIH